jgi:deoxyribonuclease-4
MCNDDDHNHKETKEEFKEKNKEINKEENKEKNKEINKITKEKNIFNIGSSINTANNMFVSSADRALELESTVYQIFLGSPRSLAGTRHFYQELISLKNKLIQNNIQLVIHSSYVLNYCNDPETYIHKAAVRLLSQDIEDSYTLGSLGCIVHMGKSLNLGYTVAISNFVLGIKRVLLNTEHKQSNIIFETGASVGTEICSSIIGLYILYTKFTPQEQKRIKFCIDTCHVFSSGYDLSSRKYIKFFCKLIKDYLGWANISVIHLNDSKTSLFEKKDRHADLGMGQIGCDGLKYFVQKCYKKNKNIAFILETPCENNFNSKMQIDLVKEWIK